MKPAYQIGIRQRVLFLALVPMLIITLILGGYFITAKLQEARRVVMNKGNEMSSLLATAAEFGILSGNPSELKPLADRLIQDPVIVNVIFLTESWDLIYAENPDDVRLEALRQGTFIEETAWHFLHPVILTPLQTNSYSEFEILQEAEQVVGWVALTLSTEPALHRQQQIIRNSLLIISLGLIVTLLLASLMAQRIISPISALSQVIRRLQRSDLNARAEFCTTIELNTLAEGINQLATNVQLANLSLQSQVKSTTEALTKALEQMEIANEELSIAHDQAHQANRAKDIFLARMSHELRTPLTSVIGFTQMLHLNNTPEQQQHYLEIIDQASQALLSIIDDILDISRLESDAIRLERLPFDPAKLCRDLIEMYAPQAVSKGVRIVFKGDEASDKRLIGDPARIRQILTNLLTNAIKFTHRGEIIIELKPRSNLSQGVEVRVRDTGIGIPARYREHLFTTFTQADSTISRRYGGSGLGLAIVKRLLNLMGGDIRYESVEGYGTEFIIDLPLPELDKKEAELFLEPETPPLPALLEESQLKLDVILAEDNPFNSLLLSRLLTEMGCELRHAETGSAVLEMAAEHLPDLILMDINMPIMDGISASRELLVQHPQLEIIILTANINEYQAKALNELKLKKILSKPLNINQLHAYLQQLNQRINGFKLPLTAPEKLKELGSMEELQKELLRLYAALQYNLHNYNPERLRALVHQLEGIAGLYEMPEIEAVVAALALALNTGSAKQLWYRMHQLERIAKTLA